MIIVMVGFNCQLDTITWETSLRPLYIRLACRRGLGMILE